MTRLPRRIAEAAAQLGSASEGDWYSTPLIPNMLAECVGLDKSMLYQLDVTGAGVRLATAFCDQNQMEDDVRRIFGNWLSSGRPFAHFDATCPDPRQRNSVVTLTALRQLVPLRPEDEAIYTELWPSMGLANFEQLRVLVCEGDSLLAWVGGFQESTPRQAQIRALEALAPALQRRLSWERWMGDLTGRAAGLEQLIESNLRPTFLLGRNARIITENNAGRAWLTEDRDQLLRILGELGSGVNCRGAEVLTVTARSFGQPLTLVTLSRPLARGHTAHGHHFTQLPSRLRRVAVAVASGLTDKEVATALGLSVSTVRTYVRQLYGLLGVHNRVQLASAISRP